MNQHRLLARRFSWARAALALVMSIGAALPAYAQQLQPRFLAREQITLYGIGLKAEPARQVVPKDIATIVSTFLQAPTLPNGLPGFAPDAEVRATLRGPSFAEAQELVVKPNTPFNIPPLTVPGIHTLENIRLITNGDVLLRAVPESVVIEVIEKLLVTQVTARTLTADEIRERGIVFDKSSFQAFNFAAAFAIEDHQITIEFPVILPQVQGAQDVAVSQIGVPTIDLPSLPSLQTIIPDTLKLQAQIPNLSVVGFTLKLPELAGQDLFLPPIPGVIVIPGDIGFLNQFFAITLMVGNVAPLGSNLVVSNLEAEIVLPPGADLVPGSGDDPLRMARNANGETPRKKIVVQPGPDGRLGTSDDIVTLGPGESGNAEYLVEGMREGSHVVEMTMKGMLLGLPIGPVPVTGRAAGSVLVRNPTFTLTFTHPETVTAGEPYALDVTVTNSGQSPANFVSVNLFPRNVSGATIVGSSTREIETIAPGDSASVSFDLISRVTGKVTAATLDSNENVSGRFALKTGVGELDVPLSPDSLVLPKESQSLPRPLRDAAIGLLGKAWAVATAPPAALPKDVPRFSKKAVIDRAIEVAEAGFRVGLHEPAADSAAHLAMDFMGNKYAWLPQTYTRPDDLAFAQSNFTGFDALRRQSIRGDRFADAVAAILAPGLSTLGGAAFHSALASRWSYRPEHISALVTGAGVGPTPFRVSIIDGIGRRVGGSTASGKIVKDIPFSDLLPFPLASDGLSGELAVIASPGIGAYTVRLDQVDGAPNGTPYVLSLVVPDGDGLQHLTFSGVTGQGIPVVPSSSGSHQIHVEMFAAGQKLTGDAIAASVEPVDDPPPTIQGAVQQLEADQLRCSADSPGIPVGRVIAVLFSEEVTAESAQDKLRADQITNYLIENNQVVGVALQPGRRIAFLALRDPYGPFVPRQVTVSNVKDVRGQAMPAASVPIESTMSDDAGVVSGTIRNADGKPVALGDVRLFYLLDCDLGDPQWIGISAKTADAQGRYSWDYVSRRLMNRIVAVDGESNESRDVRFTVQRNGQRLNVDVVMLGRGSFHGRTLAENGKVLPKTAIRVTSLTDNSQYGATSDDEGKFAIGFIPVGNVLVEGVNQNAKAQVFFSENIPFAGAVTSRDITLLDVAMHDVTIKTGRVDGFVYGANGVTPVASAPVIAYYRSRTQANVPCPKAPGIFANEPDECAVAVTTTGANGSFTFEKLTAGELRLYAFDQASLAQGEARVVLPADGRRTANVLLAGGLGTVTGRVVDPAGAPLAGARVGGGFTLATTDANGEFTLTDVPVGRRDIVAVSDTLGTSGTVTVDIARAGETVGVTIVLQSVGSVAGRVLRADGAPAGNIKVYLFRQMDSDEGPKIQVFGIGTTDTAGAYRIDKVQMGSYQISAFTDDFSDGNIGKVVLKFHQQVFRADIKFRGAGGTVQGAVFNDDGNTPLRARLGISGDQLVVAAGQVGVAFKYIQNFRIVDTPLESGAFSFSGLWVGDFTLRAVGQFSPDPIAVDGSIPAENQTVHLDLRLKATSQIAGIVYQPDAVTPVGANVVVHYKSDAFKMLCSKDDIGEETCVSIPQGIQSENAVTDQSGRFFFSIVNAGSFTITAEDPVTGKGGQIKGSVKAGETADLSVRLLGQSELTVRVLGSDTTTPIANAKVDVEQIAYPHLKKTLIAGPDGVIVFAGGDAFSEGELTITATDQSNGFVGRGSIALAGDGQQVTARIYLANASGAVFGIVYQSDGLTPVSNADVVVSNASGPLSFGVTDGDGKYRVEKIPIGPFFVESFDAATARRAFASADIPFANTEVPVLLVQGALGVVRGTLVHGGTLTALKGWEITLQQTSKSGRPLPTLKTTTSADGSWSFPGTSRGGFVLSAHKADVQGTTAATGEVEREGQIIEVPLVVNSLRPLSGRVEGTVFNSDGTRAANSIVELCYAGRCAGDVPPVRTTADASGAYAFDDVPIGRFNITARGQVTRNVGRRYGDLELDGDVLTVDVAMVGLTEISGRVIRTDGTAATSAVVKLEGSPSSGCDAACTQGVKPADGTFAFVDVPARTFTVSALDPVTGLKGAAGGTLNSGEHKEITVVLEPTGIVSGRVLRAAGQPAQGIVAELIVGPGLPGERRLYRESLADGTFTFDPAPLGNFALNLDDPAGTGIARRSGTVAGNGSIGDVLLDEAPPSVATMSPAAASTAVARNERVRIVFTEPILPGTVSSTTVRLEGPNGPVASTLDITDGDTTVTLTPLAQLADETRYVVKVENVKDRVGKTMPARFTASFTTVDVTAPAFVSVVPAPSANGVPIVTPVRIQFSEAIDPTKFRGPPLTLTGPLGQVAGRLDYILGNTVLVFTPNLPLAEDASYRATMSAAVDVAGNEQSQPLDYTFSTTDRTPPQIDRLVAAASVIENTTTVVTADVGTSHDVAVVDWYVNDVFMLAGRSAPFTFNLKALAQFGGPGSQIKISALATDTSGNRGTSPVSTSVAVTADALPTVSIVKPAAGTSARNGDRITVDVSAADDVGLTQIAFKANTGQAQDAAIRTFDPAVLSRTESFAFTIPPTATPGSSIAIEASTLDSKGNTVKATPIAVTVLDAVNPTVTITGTTSGTKVNPGQTTTAIVSAEDLGGIGSITFTVAGALTSTETRTIDPAQGAVAASFVIHVPQNARPGQTLTLDAAAVDRAGNRGTAARILLPVADSVPPTVRLSTASGSTELVRGQTLTVFADAEDEIALSRVELTGQGAFTIADAKPVSPPVGSARVPFTITVPGTLDPGATLTLRATAVDISGNSSTPAILALSVKSLVDITLPSSATVIAGESQAVAVQLAEPAPAGGQRVDLTTGDSTVATVPQSVQFGAGETTRQIQIAGVSGGTTAIRALIQGVQRSIMTVTVRGGIVRGVVFDAMSRPVAGAQLTINDTVAATTNGAGEYFAEGVTGSFASVKALDPINRLRGHVIAPMTRPGGFANVNVVLVAAGAVSGDVKTAGAQPAGAGVRVELYAAADLRTLLAFTFTNDASQFEFPLVAQGNYVLDAIRTDGHRGRSSATINASGDEETVSIKFLGEGVVVGKVLDGAGSPVARAPITFRSLSVFGAAPPTTTNAEADGTFRFDRVLVGSFSVEGRDDVTGKAGTASGEIAQDGQTVTADVHLSTYGGIRGVVRRPDGATPVVGAVVTVLGHSTITNDLGEYSFAFLPLGPFTITVNDSGTRQRGLATGTLTTQGETKTVDVTLYPQGTVVVTVNDASGNPVAGAQVSLSVTGGGFSDTLSGTTIADGTAVIEHVLVGSFTVSATAGALHGQTAGDVAANEVKRVTVALEPTGSITGIVYEPDGQTPAAGARVSLPGLNAITGADGVYRFDGLTLPPSYSITVFDALGRARARTKAPLKIVFPGQIVISNFTLAGLGTVTGRVLNPDASSAQNLTVSVQSFNADFGGVRVAATNAGGFYSVANVPVGAFTVSTGDVSRQLLGEGAGTIDAHGATATVDILLVSNAVTLPLSRFDANNYLFDVQRDASLRTGSGAFRVDGGLLLDVIRDGVANRFAGSTIATVENSGREIAARQQGLAGVTVTRKVFVPRTGYFARYLDTISNPTDQPITIDVRVTSQLQHTVLAATSSGDAVLDVASGSPDRWLVVADPVGVPVGTSALAFVFDGDGTAQHADAATISSSGARDVAVEWRSVTIPAAGTIAHVYFVAQQTGAAPAQASAERLVQLPPEALEGLSSDELAAIVNFAVPADGLSAVPALPPLAGTVDGQVLVSDQATPVANSVVRLRSTSPFFARTYQVTTGSDGRFTFANVLNDSGTSRAIPLDGFTLQASHPSLPSLLQSPQASGEFAGSTTTASRDVVFSNTGRLRGTVRVNGAAIGGASVTATGVIGSTPFTLNAQSAADGSYSIPLMPAGPATVTASTIQQGSPVSATLPVDVTAGSAVDVNVAIDTVAPQITILTPAASAQIDPRAPLDVTISATDQGGVASVAFASTGVVVRSESRGGPATTTRNETFTVPFDAPLAVGGSLTVTITATDAAGNQATASRTVTVRDVVPPSVSSIAPAERAVDIESGAQIVVQFSEPVDRASVTPASMRLTAGQTSVPVGFAFSDADRRVTMTPVQQLALGVAHIVTVDAGVTDVAGNHIAAPVTSTFTTQSPDVTPPKVSSIAPASNAVDVPPGSFIQVTFSEPIAAATINGTSVRVSNNGVTLSGTLMLLNSNTAVRFIPAQPLPLASVIVTELTGQITDAFGNALVDANGNPLAQPLTFTFLTASFGISRPAHGDDVVESRTLTLEAQGSASLGLATVSFEVNGQSLPAVSGPSFVTTFDVPPAAVTPTLTITAIGRNSSGVEVARDEVTVNVVAGLRIRPTLLGVPNGGVGRLTLGLSSPVASDLPISVTAADASIVSVPASPVVLPAGQLEVTVPIGGASIGSTTLVITSARGNGAVVASVSNPVTKTVTFSSPAAAAVVMAAPLVGKVVAIAGATRTITVPLLSVPAAHDLVVTVASSNAMVARVSGPVTLAAGDQSITLSIISDADGVATLTLRFGDAVAQLAVAVGGPTATALGPVVARPVGSTFAPIPSLGRLVIPAAGNMGLTLVLLPDAASSATPVTVSTSNATVASINGAVAIAAGERSAVLNIQTGAEGTATLTFTAGAESRQLTVVVGLPTPGDVPLTLAPPVGMQVQPSGVIGSVIAARTSQRLLTIPILKTPSATDTPVTITSSNPDVATVLETITIAAGQTAATVTLATNIDGTATLRIDAAGETREVKVIVGTPAPTATPASVAPVVGVKSGP